MTLTVLFGIGSIGYLICQLSHRARVFFPWLDNRSWRCPFLSRSATSSHRVMKYVVLWPWSPWNSHHLVMSHFASGLLGFLGHLTVLSIPFMIATSSTVIMLTLYSGTWMRSAGAEEYSLGLVNGRSVGRRLACAVNLLGDVE